MQLCHSPVLRYHLLKDSFAVSRKQGPSCLYLWLALGPSLDGGERSEKKLRVPKCV